MSYHKTSWNSNLAPILDTEEESDTDSQRKHKENQNPKKAVDRSDEHGNVQKKFKKCIKKELHQITKKTNTIINGEDRGSTNNNICTNIDIHIFKKSGTFNKSEQATPGNNHFSNEKSNDPQMIDSSQSLSLQSQKSMTSNSDRQSMIMKRHKSDNDLLLSISEPSVKNDADRVSISIKEKPKSKDSKESNIAIESSEISQRSSSASFRITVNDNPKEREQKQKQNIPHNNQQTDLELPEETLPSTKPPKSTKKTQSNNDSIRSTTGCITTKFI